MCTPKTKIKNHNESYWKHSKPFNSNTTLFLLEHVHWDNKAKTHINIKGSLNSFISDEIRRVCSQFQLPFKQNRILPEPRDNWKGSSMSGMGRFEVSLLPKLHPPQVLVAAYLKGRVWVTTFESFKAWMTSPSLSPHLLSPLVQI